MSVTKRIGVKKVVGAATVGAYLVGLGFLAGTAVERIRFDANRQSTVRKLNAETEHVKARRIELERRVDADRHALTR